MVKMEKTAEGRWSSVKELIPGATLEFEIERVKADRYMCRILHHIVYRYEDGGRDREQKLTSVSKTKRARTLDHAMETVQTWDKEIVDGTLVLPYITLDANEAYRGKTTVC